MFIARWSLVSVWTSSNPPAESFAVLRFRQMLNDEGRAILDFERASWLQPGPKDQAIEWVLGLTAHAYYEHLRGLVEGRAAFDYDPLTTKRVLRLIEEPIESELAV